MEKSEVMQLIELETASLRLELSQLKEERVVTQEKLAGLKTENDLMKDHIRELFHLVEKNEQHGRLDCLVLSGDCVPKPEKGETPQQTRKVALKVIKDKLGVDVKNEEIKACHRLYDKNRTIIKFNNMDTRNAIFEARFEQGRTGGNPLIIHESVTSPRADVLRALSDLKSQSIVGSYHTRNGQIRARKSVEYMYVVIPPGSKPQHIIELVGSAGRKERAWGVSGGGQGKKKSERESRHPANATPTESCGNATTTNLSAGSQYLLDPAVSVTGNVGPRQPRGSGSPVSGSKDGAVSNELRYVEETPSDVSEGLSKQTYSRVLRSGSTRDGDQAGR